MRCRTTSRLLSANRNSRKPTDVREGMEQVDHKNRGSNSQTRDNASRKRWAIAAIRKNERSGSRLKGVFGG